MYLKEKEEEERQRELDEQRKNEQLYKNGMIKHGNAKNIDYSKTCFHNPKMVFSHSENERPSGKIFFTQPYKEPSNKLKNANKFLQIANKGNNKIGKDHQNEEIELSRKIPEKDNTKNILEKLNSSKRDTI